MSHAHIVADEVAASLDMFHAVIKTLDGTTSEVGDQHASYIKEFDRYKIWVGNIGAHRRGQSSLDYRLRDASHIRDTVLALVLSVKQNLIEGTPSLRIDVQILSI
jgi:hypothetical protein